MKILVDEKNPFSVLKPVRLYQTVYLGKQLFADLSIQYPINIGGLFFMFDNIIFLAFATRTLFCLCSLNRDTVCLVNKYINLKTERISFFEIKIHHNMNMVHIELKEYV